MHKPVKMYQLWVHQTDKWSVYAFYNSIQECIDNGNWLSINLPNFGIYRIVEVTVIN